MRRTPFLIALLVFGLLASSCSSAHPAAAPAAGGFPNTPEGVVRKMLDAIEKNDANQYLDSIAPEDRSKPGFFFYRQIAAGLMSVIGLGGIDAAKPKVKFLDLQLLTTETTNSSAFVNVGGKLRDLNIAIEQDFGVMIKTVKRDGVWLCTLSSDTVLTPVPVASAVNEDDEKIFRKGLLARLARLKSAKVQIVERGAKNLDTIQARTSREFVRPDRLHELIDRGVFKQETIAVGNRECRKLDAGWTCGDRTAGSLLYEPDFWLYIIEGRPPSLGLAMNSHTIKSSSYIDTSQDPVCRAYSVLYSFEGEQTGKGSETDVVCFDVRTYDPVYSRRTIEQDVAVEAWLVESRYSDLDKPTEIQLPAQ